MRGNRWALGSGAVFGITVAMVLVVPFTRRHILGTLRGEPLQNGKYMGEWTEELADEDLDIRSKAASELAQLDYRGRPSLPGLAKVMREDKEGRARAGATFAIYKIANNLRRQGVHATEVLDDLIAALEDRDPVVRMDAALALAELEGDALKALPALEAGVKRRENKVKALTFTLTIREQMVTAIGFIGPAAKDALNLLEEMLDDDEETMRRQAAQSLGKLGPAAKAALPKLKKLVEEDESDIVQSRARDAIGLIDREEAEKLAEK